VCLKVGIAGPRSGKGLRERVRYHYSSNIENSVLARHLAADVTSSRLIDHEFPSEPALSGLFVLQVRLAGGTAF